MLFDDSIFLDLDAFDDLMADTEQNRICWMYHDVLSDTRIARMFAAYAGHETPAGEAWTTMAWVAAGRQEKSFYLLFKWYEDFYGPPEQGDLYYVEGDQGSDGEMLVRLMNMDSMLGQRSHELCSSLWNKISDNAIYFFGESNFETKAIDRILQLLDDNPGRELEAFDWHLGKCSDGEKAVQCDTIAAYFCGVQSVQELVYNIVATDSGELSVRDLHTRDFLSLLNHLSASSDVKRLPELTGTFQDLADEFCGDGVRSLEITRVMARSMMNLTENGVIPWIRLDGQGRRKLLRELYCSCDPRRAWDVVHRWQGDLFYTVFQRPPIRGLRRGVYLVSRFEDQRGMDITDMFWIEHMSKGVVHMCKGESFAELLDLLLTQDVQEITLHGGRRRGEDAPVVYAELLKEAYQRMEMGELRSQGLGREKIY
ncbi:MAG: hypothetical protein HUJ67_06560 [Ruminiclostridium sp.]|nr:hypothetical protein [Ruminiclostridium sp.]